MTEPTKTTLNVRGCNIALMRGGAGRSLLFLHAGGGAGWLPFLSDLAARHDVIVPEHPGFGASDTPDWLDNIQDLTRFYLDFLDQLDLSNVDLVGSSLGGWVAAELAVRNTRRLNSLTLIGSAGIHVPGVPQVDTFLLSDEQLIHSLFDDAKRIEAMIAEAKRPELEDIILKNRTTTAKLVWQPRSYDPPDRRADPPDLGRKRQTVPQGLRLRVPEAHSRLERQHHPGQRASAAHRTA
jgi:pimeloyl-ACP methyl ester carboxylesterase